MSQSRVPRPKALRHKMQLQLSTGAERKGAERKDTKSKFETQSQSIKVSKVSLPGLNFHHIAVIVAVMLHYIFGRHDLPSACPTNLIWRYCQGCCWYHRWRGRWSLEDGVLVELKSDLIAADQHRSTFDQP